MTEVSEADTAYPGSAGCPSPVAAVRWLPTRAAADRPGAGSAKARFR
jgi:hypothetical protein